MGTHSAQLFAPKIILQSKKLEIPKGMDDFRAGTRNLQMNLEHLLGSKSN